MPRLESESRGCLLGTGWNGTALFIVLNEIYFRGKAKERVGDVTDVVNDLYFCKGHDVCIWCAINAGSG